MIRNKIRQLVRTAEISNGRFQVSLCEDRDTGCSQEDGRESR